MKYKLKEYLNKKILLETEGGPDSNGQLFEEVLILEDEILQHFGIPCAKKFASILWELKNQEDIDVIINKLSFEAQEYLKSPVKPYREILSDAVINKSDPFDILPELGIITHDYTLFIYTQILLTGKSDIENILCELIKTKEDDDLLSKIYMLGTKPEPSVDKLYIELKDKYELVFLDEYLFYILEHSGKKIENYNPNYFTLSDLLINEIVFGSNSIPSIFCNELHDYSDKVITLACDFNELSQILLNSGKLGIVVKDKISELLKNPFLEEPTVIDVANIYGKPLYVRNILLEVYWPQYKNDDGIWVEDYGVLFVNSILQKNIVEPPKVDDFQAKLSSCLRTITDAYRYYINLTKLGLPEKESRKRAGLMDELLFYQASLLYNIENPSNSKGN
jgi:hypothetical protein